MKNGLIIFSNGQFNKKLLVNNCEYQINKKLITKLEKNYTVDNFSNSRLTVASAYNFIKVFSKTRSYSKCLLALGIQDIKETSITDFEMYYDSIVNLLLANGIEPVIISLPLQYVKDENGSKYQDVISAIARKYSIHILSNNKRTISSKINGASKVNSLFSM